MEENLEPSYYDKACAGDIISKFRPLLVNGGYKLRDEDGKIVVTNPATSFDTPWHHVSHDPFLDCQKWHAILFELFSKTLPDGRAFVPSPCQQCWKVVVRPQTLLGLFSLLEIQLKLNRPSKCGVELRPYVFGLYGGYFYNHSLEEGLDCYKLIRNEVNQSDHLGTDIPVILKRGCTEYEQRVRHSTGWKVTPEQIAIETLVNKWFVTDDIKRTQSDHQISTVHSLWIEFAYSYGDQTYKLFTNGEPPSRLNVVQYETYHHLVDVSDEERAEAFDKFKRRYYYGYDL